ncbi:O-linked N-acetylglucosamine transferase, SPINDLY family protein [Geomonas edaphica]|uniref:O-linked N-acetylglucosamine transferase, SPINDLY family protein n=1 Tax=Geomonas edaphica TaxID=2570226 RepID=UPI0013A5EF9F|nr:glycosyltransferase family 41 protein [Geomonas edaphica]
MRSLQKLPSLSRDTAAAIAGSLKGAAGEVASGVVALLSAFGAALMREGMQSEGLFCCRVAAAFAPGNAEALYRLGDALHDARLMREAEEALSAAVAADPRHWGACYTYGFLMQDLGRDAEAVPWYQKALQLREDHAKSHNNLASALLAVGETSRAFVHVKRAVELDPNYTFAYMNLGTMYNLEGRYRESLAAFERAATLGAPPTCRVKHAVIFPAVVSSVAEIDEGRTRMVSELRALAAEGIRLHDPVREVGITPFYLAYAGMDDLPLMRELAAFYAGACPQLLRVAPHCVAGGRKRGAGEPARVGFVSTFFYDHTVGRYFGEVMRRLSREWFHVTAISNFTVDDTVSASIREGVDECIVIPNNLAAAQQAIEEAALDALIFCDIGMEPLTYFLAFARLAPVQIALYGHPVTTGIPNVDYFLSHEDCETDESPGHYSEKLLLLSREVSYTWFRRPVPPAAPRCREDFSLAAAAHLYLCPQSVFKIHPDMDGLFAAILRDDPDAVLLLFEGWNANWNEVLHDRVAKAVPEHASRVRFLPRMPYHDYLSVVRFADVILDSLHFCGGATTFDALAMGTPVVTLPGRFMRGRQTLACYRRLGIEECIALDAGDYVTKAVTIASNPQLRDELSCRILSASAKLFEDDGMTLELGRLILEKV